MQNAFLLEPTGYMDTQVVATITPDEILESAQGNEIGILKVDIEGAERELFLSGAIDTLLRQAGVLLVETHDQFQPGASEAVYNAAIRSGMLASSANPHTEMYYRE
jgi:hypothetical protein